MDHFAGLDVSVKETSVCIVDDAGKIGRPLTAAQCDVWTAAGWQGESSRRRLGSVQPCVRPISAAHTAAA